jgi:serine/threonine protein kinase
VGVQLSELVGQTLDGQYRLVRSIATGGMGAVFEAEHVERLGTRYAIKVLHAANNAVALQRFQREAQITAELAHEHIVAVHDFRVANTGMPYLVMELLEGEDLAARINQTGPMPIGDVVTIAGQIAAGLGAAHRARIVHRDLKPQNIFLSRHNDEDFVKLLDFGVSKFRDATTPITRDNTAPGTPNYMSPEQAEGLVAEVDERTDVFAFGAVIWEMLTGRRAFDAPTLSATLYQVVHIDPPQLRLLRPDLPPGVDAVLRAALSKKKKLRYPNVAMLASALAGAAQPGSEREGTPTRTDVPVTVELATLPRRLERPRKILFVDDSPSMCALVSTWLERGGYDVITAGDGFAGMAKVRSEQPDLVIADVSMPRCDGFSLCRTLRSDPSTREIPVILFTRLDEATDIVNGLAAGVDAFVVKGSGPEDLLRQVEHLLPDDAQLSRRSTTMLERLRGSFETLGRQAIFKQLFDACFREVPFDVLAVLVDRVGQPPLLLLGSHYELAAERADALVRKIMDGCDAMRGKRAIQTIESQLVVIDDTAVWGDAGVTLKHQVIVPMLDGEQVIGCLGVFSFEDQPELDDNIRFFFDIGVAAARALRGEDA